MPTAFARACAGLLALFLAGAPAQAADEPGALPVPRFVSLRADEVNLRTGPGPRYPVEWVFVRRDLPVEVVAEFDTWRKVRDFQNTEGWVHKSMLSGRRTLVVTGEIRTLRREPSEDAPAVARAESGVVGRIQSCRETWCRAELGGFEGWLRRDEVWGLYPDERID